MSTKEDLQNVPVHVVIDDDSELHQVEVELMEIGSSCEVEVSNQDEEISTSDMISTEDQQLLREEIKEEELEDADVSQDISQQGKRLLLKDWLVQKLDNDEMPDILSWYNKLEGLFRIKWLHKATDSWEVMADGVLFKEWCMHTGKYDPNNENPRKWKANFRCALNSLPDVIIVPSLCVRKGKDAYRVFKILPEKIPEKVREKQESSRKRRREKRETLLKAYAKNQAELGNFEHAEAITKQIAMNPSNIKIHLKRNILSQVTPSISGKKPSPSSKPNTTKSKSDSSSTTRSTTSGAKTVLNGMDALCTAAAMMADTPGEGEEAEEGVTSEPAEVIPVIPVTTSASGTTIVSPLNKIGKVMTSTGDVVTYYRPVGNIPGVASRERSMISPSKPIVSVGSQVPVVTTSSLPNLPLFKSVEAGKVGAAAAITTSTGNVLLSLRLAQPGTSSSAPTIVQQGIPIPQIQGFPPGVCIQSFSPTSLTPQGGQAPAYLIPKTFIQQQIAASAGNQPARVYTVKPTKVADTTPCTAAEYARNKKLHTKGKLFTPESTSKLSVDKFGQIKIAPHFDLKDYNQFKVSIFKMMELEGNCLPFQLCKHTALVKAVRLYDSDKPNVEVSVTVATDYTFSVVVHNRTLPPIHEVLKRQSCKTLKNWIQLKLFLERLSEYVTCIGNPEEMAHRQYTDYSSFVSAYQEPDLGAKNPILRYHSTIRSNGCALLIKAPPDVSSLSEDEAKDCYRCDDCARIRIHVLSMRGLFSLLDGAKIPDTESARRKRLQHLKDYTTKDVLANRVDVLETQIKRYQQLLPTELQNIEPVTSITDMDISSTAGSDKLTETVTQSIGSAAHYVTSISESVDCTGNGEVQNVIRVTLSHPDGANNADLSEETVYHIVDNSSHSSDIMLVTDDDNMLNEQTTERLLEELTNSALSNT